MARSNNRISAVWRAPARRSGRRFVALLAASALLATVALVPTAMAQDDQDERFEQPIPPTDEQLQASVDLGYSTAAAFTGLTKTTVDFEVPQGSRGIDVDPLTGAIFVADRNADLVLVLDANGNEITTIAAGTDGAQGLHLAPNGEIYVTAENGDAVSVWDQDGTFKRSWGTTGAGNGQFNEPCDVFVTPTGEVFVADANNDRVQVFDVNGGFLRQFGTTGSGNAEFDMDCSGASLVILGSEIFVTDEGNHRVQVFDLAGTYLRQWGSLGAANGQFNQPGGITTANGSVYVTDYFNNRVQVFTPGGIYEGQIDVGAPRGLWVDPTGTVMRVTRNTIVMESHTSLTCDGMDLTHVGSSYPDTFNGTVDDDLVHTGDGDDTYDGLAGDDRICAGSGDDEIRGSAGRDRIKAGPGNDTVFGGLDIDYVFGEVGNDTLDGEGGSDRMYGGDGNDLMLGDSGADRMYGGPGDDEMRGMGGQDFMWGEAGNDLMQGNFQTDNMFGGPGNDTMFGAGGKDSLFGEAGNDSLSGGNNTDYLDGGNGVDTANGGRGRDRPVVAPSVRPSNGQFFDGSGCIAETIVNCQ